MSEMEWRPSKRTIPLTKAQLATAAGTELLALCQTITEDGSIHDEEVAALRGWLEQNRSSDLPSVEFLVQTVEKILADGRIDDCERRDLHKALERVLPPAARREAVAAREDAELRERINNPRVLHADERVGPIYDFMVAGVAYEDRAHVVEEYLGDEDLVYLCRDRGNRYSRNAVEIRLANGKMIGFVPEEFARQIAPRLDGGHPYHAWVKKILVGGRTPIPVVLAELLRKESSLPFAMREGQLPPGAAVHRREPAIVINTAVAPTASTKTPQRIAMPATPRSRGRLERSGKDPTTQLVGLVILVAIALLALLLR